MRRTYLPESAPSWLAEKEKAELEVEEAARAKNKDAQMRISVCEA